MGIGLEVGANAKAFCNCKMMGLVKEVHIAVIQYSSTFHHILIQKYPGNICLSDVDEEFGQCF